MHERQRTLCTSRRGRQLGRISCRAERRGARPGRARGRVDGAARRSGTRRKLGMSAGPRSSGDCSGCSGGGAMRDRERRVRAADAGRGGVESEVDRRRRRRARRMAARAASVAHLSTAAAKPARAARRSCCAQHLQARSGAKARQRACEQPAACSSRRRLAGACWPSCHRMRRRASARRMPPSHRSAGPATDPVLWRSCTSLTLAAESPLDSINGRPRPPCRAARSRPAQDLCLSRSPLSGVLPVPSIVRSRQHLAAAAGKG